MNYRNIIYSHLVRRDVSLLKVFYYTIPIIVIALVLQYHFYNGSSIILGGEGNFFIDFSRHSKVYGSTWFDTGYGWPNVIPNAVGINHDILTSLENITNNYKHVNFALILLMYTLPYLAFLLLARHLNLNRNIAVIIAILYAIGPFSINYLQALNQWNVFSISIMPLLYYLVLKYSDSSIKLFVSIGIVTRLMSFSLYNPPTAVIVLSVILVAGLHKVLSKGGLSEKLFQRYLKIIFIAYLGFLIFNLDWLSVLFYSIQHSYIDIIFTSDFASNWAQVVSAQDGLFLKAISHRQIIASNTILDSFYNHSLFVAFLYGITGLLIIRCALNKDVMIKIFSILIVLLIFLTKGAASPFGGFYIYLMENLPYFYIFKTPTEKFGILLNFIFFVSLVTILGNGKEVLLKVCMVILTALCLIPVVFFDGLAASSNDGNYKMSRKHVLDNGDINVINYLTMNYKNMRVLTLPGGLNYQIMTRSEHGVYTGLDPVLNNAHISYIHPGIDNEIYEDIFSLDWLQRLRDRGISAVTYNTKEIPWFGKSVKENINVLRKYFKEAGVTETLIGDYYIWHVSNSKKRIEFEKY